MNYKNLKKNACLSRAEFKKIFFFFAIGRFNFFRKKLNKRVFFAC